MHITRFGHSALLVEAPDTRVLIDPGGFSPDETFELDQLDAIVVTHQHPDHIDRERGPNLVERNPGALLIADPESAATLEFGDWTPSADRLETVVGAFTLRGIGAQHAVIVPELPRVANVGVLVTEHGGRTLFHPGDSYEHVPDGVDVLALPLSAPWTKISETVAFVTKVSPTTMFPIHDSTIADAAYGIYWNHCVNFGGVEDARKLGRRDSIDA